MSDVVHGVLFPQSPAEVVSDVIRVAFIGEKPPRDTVKKALAKPLRVRRSYLQRAFSLKCRADPRWHAYTWQDSVAEEYPEDDVPDIFIDHAGKPLRSSLIAYCTMTVLTNRRREQRSV
jgi:hypothetical protein